MKGVKSIKGNKNPKIGTDVYYEVESYYPGTTQSTSTPVKWKLFSQNENGSWRELKGTLKTGEKVSFNFPSKWYGKKLLVEAFLNSPEKKSPPGIIISPVQGDRKITHLYLRDMNNKPFTTPPKYGENIKLNIVTQNLYGETITVGIWERDTVADTGHDAKENTLLDTLKIKVDNIDGKISQTLTLKVAWRVKAQKGAFEGTTHEYYLVASAPNTKTVFSVGTTEVSDAIAGEKTVTEKAITAAMQIIDNIVKTTGKDATLTGVGNQQTPVNNGCGGQFCIDKKTPANELIREINTRLAGFGGNVPTDTFTDRSEKMVKQFQRDYMKVPETGKVCGNVLVAIDEFSKNFDLSTTLWNQLKCSCTTKGKKATNKLKGISEMNNCNGFGDGTGKNTYSGNNKKEAYHRYEYPGIHRSLLFGFKALQFYFSKQTTYKIDHFTSGYRCRFKNYKTTNHQGKAIDIQFSKDKWQIRGPEKRNLVELRKIRDDFFIKQLGSQKEWPGKNVFSIEPIDLLYYGDGSLRYDYTFSWIHMDVREFDATHLQEKNFCTNSSTLNGKSIVALAKELGFTNTCNCLQSVTATPKPTSTGGCLCFNEGKVKVACNGKGIVTPNDIYEKEAKRLGIDLAMIQAIAKQESKRNSFYSEGQATILFERHKMWEYLEKDLNKTKKQLEDLQKEDPSIVNLYSGGYGKYSEQYAKLEKAKKIDYATAVKACSWGKFQVMGFNYDVAFSSPQALESAVNLCEVQQFYLFVGYLENTGGMITAMKNKKWEVIAAKYNGGKWREKNPNYATNIEKFYNEFKK